MCKLMLKNGGFYSNSLGCSALLNARIVSMEIQTGRVGVTHVQICPHRAQC